MNVRCEIIRHEIVVQWMNGRLQNLQIVLCKKDASIRVKLGLSAVRALELGAWTNRQPDHKREVLEKKTHRETKV